MTTDWLEGLEKAHRATSREELEAIYRFRYTIYVEELGREIGGVDHERRMVHDEDDEKDFSTHLYVGDPGDIAGSLRVRVWDPGCIPKHDYDMLSLELFPNIEEMRVAEMGRLMIDRSMRGRLVLLALMQEAYSLLAGEKEADLAFGYCRPGLVRHYRMLGSRPYCGRLIPSPEGMAVPIVLVLSDLPYFQEVGSPAALLVDRYFGPGKRDPIDLSLFEGVFNDDLMPVDTDPGRIWDRVQRAFLQEQVKHKATSFLDSLSEETLKKLSDDGFIMHLPEGTLVTKEGHLEREMYVILDGTFEAFAGQRVLAIMDKGDLFGEVAFFRESGRRSASVRALTDGRLLVLRRNVMKELSKADPETAYTILFNLGRILAERLVSSRPQM
jgi:N-acyl-L-homoserine lactone synthetase